MPIDTIHTSAKEYATRWKRCRDAVSGQYSVHESGETYLPRLKDQTNEDYAAYKGRAGWYGATGRTLQGLVGMVFRRAPMLEAPPALERLAADLTLDGRDVDGVSRCLLEEVISVGRVGVLVEYPTDMVGPMTLADAERMNRRPYVTTYKAEQIRNWRAERVMGAVKATLIVLDETVEVIDSDPFEPEQKKQLRILKLEDGRYVQEVHRQDRRGEWQLIFEATPMQRGQPMDTIPFVFVGPDELGAEVQKPPILDLADVNFGHYKNTADLEHGAHFAGLPTPVISGYQADEGEKLYVGSAAAWVFPDPSAKASYLEFTGQGLGALEARCKAKEQHMAALGARMLAPDKNAVESGEALNSRNNGEHSTLAGWAGLVSDAMTRILKICADWEGIGGDVSYKLNTDYTPTGLTAQQLTALVQAWQAGGISWETFFWNLKEGEIVAPEVSEEDERDRLEAAGPALGLIDDSQSAAA